ncbi:dynamin family protein [Kitasatospora sp. cg17-2]
MTAADLRRAALAVLTGAAGAEHLPEEFRRALAEQAERLAAPFAVALVGRVSSGKSTLVNALLGTRLAPTGVTELTMTVNRFRYGDPAALAVHFEDGTVVHHPDLSALEALTVRAADDPRQQELLRRIDHLETAFPHPALAGTEIVDTPGLDSATGPESAATLRLLGRTASGVTESTVTEGARADALVLTFTERGVHREELRLTADFLARVPGLGPLNTVGALTKTELFWDPADCPDPFVPARRVADQLLRTAGASRLLYTVVPVAGLLASGAAELDAADLADLTALAAGCEPHRLAELAAEADRFTAADGALPLPAAARARLYRRFGGWGVATAQRLVRDGATGAGPLRAELLRLSGLDALRAVLRDHFAGRADLIKAARAFRTVPRLAERTAAGRQAEPARAVAAVAGAFTAVELRHGQAYAELRALRDHFEGRLDLPAEQVAELLRVTGEHGGTAADRLGLPPGTDRAALLAAARSRLDHWHRVLAAPTVRGPARQAQLTVRDAYEALHHDLSRSEQSR